jgi:hypothetical protein
MSASVTAIGTLDGKAAADDVVHQLYAVTSPKDRKTGTEVLAKCGVTVRYPSGGGLPATMSGWAGQVTCPQCLGQSFDDSLERWHPVFGEPAVWPAIKDAVEKARTVSGRRG